jgi:hypothetical protein
MSHAETADKLLIKPAAGARPAPPRTRRQFIPKARTRRPVTRRVTRGTRAASNRGHAHQHFPSENNLHGFHYPLVSATQRDGPRTAGESEPCLRNRDR